MGTDAKPWCPLPDRNPVEIVQLPKAKTVNSADRTYTLEEARQVLTAARKESAPELRWLPWLCAYSGARINEVAQLTPSDVFQVGEDWFFRLTTAGGKSLKTISSARRVPIHPAIIAEGFVEFVRSHKNQAARMFPARSQPNLSEWIRGDAENHPKRPRP